MTGLLPLLVAAITVAPTDRLAMADRLFNRGDYAAASREYATLEREGAKGIAGDGLLFRQAECSRALGRTEEAQRLYAELLAKHPDSRHADRARLMKALSLQGAARVAELKALDSDRVSAALRATALYHLGEATGDRAAFERCLALDPKGRYAEYAKLRVAVVGTKSADPAERRRAVASLLEITFGGNSDIADEALYLAAAASFSDKKYSESGSLFRRYLKTYPKGRHAAASTDYCAWSDYLAGKYADVRATCGAGRTDDTAYLKAAAAYASGDREQAMRFFQDYLENFPQGRHRAAVELPLARIRYETADAAGKTVEAIAAAKRCAELSGAATDALRLAWAYEKGGRTVEAETGYRAVAERFPGTPEAADAMFRKAMLDLREEKWSAAELALKEALAGKLDPRRRSEASYWRGIAACRLGHDAEGVAMLREAVKGGLSLDQSREARLALADADYNAGRHDEAMKAYAKLVREGAAVRMTPAKAHAVGLALLSHGDAEAARLAAEQLVKSQSPEWRQFGHALAGDADTALGNLATAAESYGQCLDEKCRTEVVGPVALKLGRHRLAEGDLTAAEPLLKKAVELSGNDVLSRANAYLALAQLAKARGDIESAKGYLTVILSLFDKLPVAEAAGAMMKALEEAK